MFRIRIGGHTGTAFTFEIDGLQYLATAKHVVEAGPIGNEIHMARGGGWAAIRVHRIWKSEGEADIAILSPMARVSPAHPIALGGARSYFLSERVYFLGFPFGLQIDGGTANEGFPIPLVKSGIVSGFRPTEGGVSEIFIDGHNNAGFSGGPIVKIAPDASMCVIGVVSGYLPCDEPVHQSGIRTNLSAQANSGIFRGFGLDAALAHARASKSGAPIV